MATPDTLQPRASEPPTFAPFEGQALCFGRYEIIGQLAKGGMGTVYLCRRSGDAGFRRLYALKVVHEHMATDPEVIDMLLDEARLASRLHHPNVVPILDLGSVDGRYYLAMDYVEGCSLSQLCRRYPKRRPHELIVPLVIDSLEGLHAAHSLVDDDGEPLGLVHRDVSPQNLLVGVDGIGRLIDFGIAKASARKTTTDEGRMKGKLGYMSPEQINGELVDARSDIFAAGVTLWTVLTGENPFQADSDGATVRNILAKRVPPPSTVGLRPPACFDAVCLRALERDPADRYQTAEEMAEALRQAVEDGGMRTPRSEIAELVKRTFHRELAARREAIRERSEPSPARPSFASIDDVEALPGLTTPAFAVSKVPDRDAAPRLGPRHLVWAVLLLALGGGAAFAIWSMREVTPLDAATWSDAIPSQAPVVAPPAPEPTTAEPPESDAPESDAPVSAAPVSAESTPPPHKATLPKPRPDYGF